VGLKTKTSVKKLPVPRVDGLTARRLAAEVIEDVLRRRLPLDERLEGLSARPEYQALAPNDRGLTRAIATSAFRRLGTIRRALNERVARGFPPKSGQLEAIMIAACAQILALDTPVHAAVDTAVSLVREDPHAKHFADLANAVMRRIATEKADILASSDPLETDTPPWLAARWTRAFGPEVAHAIATAHGREPAIDITLRDDAEESAAHWAELMGAEVLPTGSLRLTVRTAVPQLPGFAEGAWWVQDAAAAIPARLIRAKTGMRVLDLCAAPGGKTAQLASSGADVTAIDRSAARMERLLANMARLNLDVTTHVGTAETYTGPPADAVLVDAPCSATGTLRRHPDVAWSKTLEDVLKLSMAQARLLDHAANLVNPGGVLVYATCSLESEEGEQQITRFLARNAHFSRDPVNANEVGGLTELISPQGDLRCLPSYLPNAVHRMAGLDGFFASRLVRQA
jgi:16S rRNA (cytosine967-C5)-methyltransferase